MTQHRTPCQTSRAMTVIILLQRAVKLTPSSPNARTNVTNMASFVPNPHNKKHVNDAPMQLVHNTWKSGSRSVMKPKRVKPGTDAAVRQLGWLRRLPFRIETRPVPPGLVRFKSFANADDESLPIVGMLTWQPHVWDKVSERSHENSHGSRKHG